MTNYTQRLEYTLTKTGTGAAEPLERSQYGITWSALEPEEWVLIEAVIDGSLDQRRRIVAALSHELEGSTRLALDALRALADEGAVIIQKAAGEQRAALEAIKAALEEIARRNEPPGPIAVDVLDVIMKAGMDARTSPEVNQ